MIGWLTFAVLALGMVSVLLVASLQRSRIVFLAGTAYGVGLAILVPGGHVLPVPVTGPNGAVLTAGVAFLVVWAVISIGGRPALIADRCLLLLPVREGIYNRRLTALEHQADAALAFSDAASRLASIAVSASRTRPPTAQWQAIKSRFVDELVLAAEAVPIDGGLSLSRGLLATWAETEEGARRRFKSFRMDVHPLEWIVIGAACASAGVGLGGFIPHPVSSLAREPVAGLVALLGLVIILYGAATWYVSVRSRR